MRKLLLIVALVSTAAFATGISLDHGAKKTFTNCESGGSAAQTLTRGTYLLTVTDKDVNLCFAASGSTCASGGNKFPSGTVMMLSLATDQLSVSCRSSDSTGDVDLTPAS